MVSVLLFRVDCSAPIIDITSRLTLSPCYSTCHHPILGRRIYIYIYIYIYKVRLTTLVEGDPKVLFSRVPSPTPKCSRARQNQVPFFESFARLDVWLNPSLPDHWRNSNIFILRGRIDSYLIGPYAKKNLLSNNNKKGMIVTAQNSSGRVDVPLKSINQLQYTHTHTHLTCTLGFYCYSLNRDLYCECGGAYNFNKWPQFVNLSINLS